MRNYVKPAFLLLLSASFLLSCGGSEESASSSADAPSSSSSSESARSEEPTPKESEIEESSSSKSISSSSEASSSEKSEESSETSLTSNEPVSSEEPMSEEESSDGSSSEDASSEDETTYYVVSFDSMGGSAVASQRVKKGEKAVEPDSPTKDGYEFQGWYKSKTYAVAFSFETAITTDYELFAKWGTSSEASSEQTDSSEIEDSGEETVSPHGPEGSTLVSWYLCGSGSLWGDDGWSTFGGVQLFSNPSNEADKGCILDITISSGDIFKVTDGTSWFGYEKVSQYAVDNNKGITNFTGQDDGYGGQNIKCTVSGTYDIYVNSSGEFWIQ